MTEEISKPSSQETKSLSRRDLVSQAFEKIKEDDNSLVFENFDPQSSLYFRGVNLGSLLLYIAQGTNLLNKNGETMHVEMNPELARPYALTDSMMSALKIKPHIIEQLHKLGINTDTLGPGIILGLSEKRATWPSDGAHGVTIKSPYPLKSIDSGSKVKILELTGIDIDTLY